MPDAATNTPLVDGLAPLACLGAANILESLKTDDLQNVMDKLSLTTLVMARAVSKEFYELAQARAAPVMRLRANPFNFTMAEILEGTVLVAYRNTCDPASIRAERRPALRLEVPLAADGGLHLANALVTGALPLLKQLHLAGNGITDACLSALGVAAAKGGLASLRLLTLEDNRIGDGGLAAFCNPSSLSPVPRTLATPERRISRAPVILLPMLEELRLSLNPVRDDGALALERAIGRGHFPKLMKLALDPEIGDAVVDALKKALPLDAEIEQMPGGLEVRDVELVRSQAGVSRYRAAVALCKYGGDVVDAIMSLTTSGPFMTLAELGIQS